MTAADFVAQILTPSLAIVHTVAPELTDTPKSRVMLLAIAGQESAWAHRIQGGNGPAHGFWQFERAGGVRSVLHHPATGPILRAACPSLGVGADEVAIWARLATVNGDPLACLLARLLLWSDPRPLPTIGDADGSREYYEANWRPGKPSAARWDEVYPQAVNAVG